MIQPIRNNVLVKPFKENNVSAGGIVVPENYRKDGCRVMIVAVGSGTQKREMKLRSNTVGFRVKEWGTPIEDNGELFYIMDDSAIIALV